MLLFSYLFLLDYNHVNAFNHRAPLTTTFCHQRRSHRVKRSAHSIEGAQRIAWVDESAVQTGVGFEHGSAAMVTTTAANPETPETHGIPIEINRIARNGAGAMEDHRPATPPTMSPTMAFLSGASSPVATPAPARRSPFGAGATATSRIASGA